MNETGSIELVGTIDIESIKYGLRELKNGMESAKNMAASAFGDLKRLGESVEGIAGPLGKIGAGLVSSALGIAALSPQVAPVLASMQADFLRMSRILGEELRPVFDQMAQGFEDFVNWLDSDSGRGVIVSVGEALQTLGTFAKGVIEAIQNISGYSTKSAAAEGNTVYGQPGQTASQIPGVVTNKSGQIDILSTLVTGTLVGAGFGGSVGSLFAGVGAAPGAVAGGVAGAAWGGTQIGMNAIMGPGAILEGLRQPLRDAIIGGIELYTSALFPPLAAARSLNISR